MPVSSTPPFVPTFPNPLAEQPSPRASIGGVHVGPQPPKSNFCHATIRAHAVYLTQAFFTTPLFWLSARQSLAPEKPAFPPFSEKEAWLISTFAYSLATDYVTTAISQEVARGVKALIECVRKPGVQDGAEGETTEAQIKSILLDFLPPLVAANATAPIQAFARMTRQDAQIADGACLPIACSDASGLNQTSMAFQFLFFYIFLVVNFVADQGLDRAHVYERATNIIIPEGQGDSHENLKSILEFIIRGVCGFAIGVGSGFLAYPADYARAMASSHPEESFDFPSWKGCAGSLGAFGLIGATFAGANFYFSHAKDTAVSAAAGPTITEVNEDVDPTTYGRSDDLDLEEGSSSGSSGSDQGGAAQPGMSSHHLLHTAHHEHALRSANAAVESEWVDPSRMV